MRELGLPDAPARSILSARKEAPRRYCVMIPFNASPELLASTTGVGLFLAQIGQNWQVYLNGSLVRDETYTASDGSLRVERAVRGVLVELDTRYLKRGKNLLTLMVMGDPLDDRTGLFMGGPYLVDAYGALESRRGEGLKLMLIGIYFFFGLYHAVLFAFRPKAKAYLYYGLAAALLSTYLLCRTFIVYELLLDTRVIKGLERSALFLLVPAFMAFFDSVLGRRVSAFAKAYGAFFSLAAVLRFFFFDEAFLRLWQYTVALPILYVLVIDIGKPLVAAMRGGETGPGGSGWGAAWRAVARTAKTDAAKLLLGALVVGAAVLLDIAGLNAGRATAYSDYAYLLLVFGTAATLAGQFVGAYNQSEALGADLARRVEARSGELEATLAEQGALSVRLSETSARLQARVDASSRDMSVATRVQQGFFPSHAPRTAHWDTAFAFTPASGVSGDFYDFYQRGDRLDGLVVGDVSGHGIASGLITVLARSIFYRNFHELKGRSLGSMLESINGELIAELSSVEHFVTAALLRLEAGGGVEYASAAHAEVLYKGAEKARAAPIKPKGGRDYKGPPLGREGLEAPYSSIRFAMKPGDVILVHTDGFDEAKNVDGVPFGMEGMLEALSASPEGDAAQMLDFIVREWRFHVSGTKVADDATAVLIKRL
jgi:serine phosphatase RsbU (regulator of sigma subunit)